MKQSEKDQLISQLKAKLTDWNTQYVLGHTKGIEQAIEVIEVMPVDESGIIIPEEHVPIDKRITGAFHFFLNRFGKIVDTPELYEIMLVAKAAVQDQRERGWYTDLFNVCQNKAFIYMNEDDQKQLIEVFKNS